MMFLSSEHNEHLYPHAHTVMPRLRPGMLKRGEVESGFMSEDVRTTKPIKVPRKSSSKKLVEGISPMPTIPDFEDEKAIAEEGVEPELLGARQKSAAFSIAFDEEDEEEEEMDKPAKIIYTREMSRDSQDKWAKKREHGSESDTSRFRSDSQVSSSHDEGGLEEGLGDEDQRKKTRKKRRKHRIAYEEELRLRRMKGSEVQMDSMWSGLPTEQDEAEMLGNRDVEDMAFHRMEHLEKTGRKMIKKRPTGASLYEMSDGVFAAEKEEVKAYDHSPHDLFVEMDELEGDQWVEQARWIKYEEDREEGAERWGKAHISSLSFHSLINLRLCLEGGVIILDLEARDLPGVVYRVVEELYIEGNIEEYQKGEILRVLLYRHKYVDPVDEKGHKRHRLGGNIRKNLSNKSLNVSYHTLNIKR